MEKGFQEYEAIEWLTNNKNISALATNRFGETSNAIKFVEELYEAGAVSVKVIDIYDEPERIAAEGGAYASAVIVELPEQIEKREKIKAIYIKEIQTYQMNEGDEESVENEYEGVISFWWD